MILIVIRRQRVLQSIVLAVVLICVMVPMLVSGLVLVDASDVGSPGVTGSRFLGNPAVVASRYLGVPGSPATDTGITLLEIVLPIVIALVICVAAFVFTGNPILAFGLAVVGILAFYMVWSLLNII